MMINLDEWKLDEVITLYSHSLKQGNSRSLGFSEFRVLDSRFLTIWFFANSFKKIFETMQKKEVEFTKDNIGEVFHLLSTSPEIIDAKATSSSKAKNGQITAKSLATSYNKFKNILDIDEESMQVALNSFSQELLDDKSEKVESLDQAAFEKGLLNFEKVVKSSGKDSQTIYHEIMKICAQLADYNPQQLAELLDLPEELNRQDILRLMNSMVRPVT